MLLSQEFSRAQEKQEVLSWKWSKNLKRAKSSVSCFKSLESKEEQVRARRTLQKAKTICSCTRITASSIGVKLCRLIVHCGGQSIRSFCSLDHRGGALSMLSLCSWSAFSSPLKLVQSFRPILPACTSFQHAAFLAVLSALSAHYCQFH